MTRRAAPSAWLVLLVGTLWATAILAGLYLRAESARIAFSTIHFGVAGAAIIGLGWVAEKRVPLLFFPVAFPVVMHVIYFTVSGLKYFSDNPMYPEFRLTLQERFAGSMVTGLLILCMIAMVARFADEALRRGLDERRFDASSTLLAGICIIDAALVALLIQQGVGGAYSELAQVTRTSYDRRRDVALMLVEDSVGYMAATVTAAALAKRVTLTRAAIAVAFCAMQLHWIVAVRQERGRLLAMILIALCGLQLRRPALSVRTLQVGLVLLPVLSLTANTAVLMLMGREAASGLQASCDHIAYRSDLSDFGLVLARGAGTFKQGSTVVADAVRNAIPAAVLASKPAQLVESYGTAMAAAGLSRDVDYPDTLFSSGALAIGRIGGLALPLLYVLVIWWGTRFVLNHRSWGRWYAYLALPITVGVINIELGWHELFLGLRHTAAFAVPIGVLAAALRARRRGAAWRLAEAGRQFRS